MSRVRELAFHMESSPVQIASMASSLCASAYQSKYFNGVINITTLQYGPLFFCGSLDILCVLHFSPVILGLTPLLHPLRACFFIGPFGQLGIGTHRIVLLARCGCYFEVAMVTTTPGPY